MTRTRPWSWASASPVRTALQTVSTCGSSQIEIKLIPTFTPLVVQNHSNYPHTEIGLIFSGLIPVLGGSLATEIRLQSDDRWPGLDRLSPSELTPSMLLCVFLSVSHLMLTLSCCRLRGRSLLSTGGFSCSRRTWRGPRSVSPPLLRNLLRLLMLLMNQNGELTQQLQLLSFSGINHLHNSAWIIKTCTRSMSDH